MCAYSLTISLGKAQFRRKLNRSLAVVEVYACPHTIVKLTDDRNHLRHAEAGQTVPDEFPNDGVVRFAEQVVFLPCEVMGRWIMIEHGTVRRTVQTEATHLLR